MPTTKEIKEALEAAVALRMKPEFQSNDIIANVIMGLAQDLMKRGENPQPILNLLNQGE